MSSSTYPCETSLIFHSRSWDGLTLYAASSDGTIAAFQFEVSELEGIATHTDQEQYLAKFGFTPPPLPEGYSHVSKHEQTNVAIAQTQQASGFESSNAPDKVNILVAKKAPKDKKRATLMPNNASSVPTSRITPMAAPLPTTTPITNGISKRAQLNQMHDVKPPSLALHTPTSSFSNSFPPPSEQLFVDSSETWSRRSDFGHAMDLDVPIDAFDTSAPGTNSKGKRRVSSLLNSSVDNDVKVKPRTLGGDRPVEVHVPKKISTWTSTPNSRVDAGPRASGSGDINLPLLPTPSLLTYLSSEVEGSGDVLEAKNIDSDGALLSFPYSLVWC